MVESPHETTDPECNGERLDTAGDRGPHRGDVPREIGRAEARFLWLAAPPVAITVVLNLAGISLTNCIRVILVIGVASLGFWGGVAGLRAGFTGRRPVLAGLLVGTLIVAVQVVLEPGKAVSGGTV